MHSDYDITNLMYGADTAAELDIYRGEPKPFLGPLLLDTVMQGRPSVSNCRLLQMPSEILTKIVSFIAEDLEALHQLALINSDCWGLSRACQFSEYTFDYNPNKTKLLLQLAQGMLEGHVGPSIGDCIRKFTFHPDPYISRVIHSEAWERSQIDPDDEFMGTAEIKEQATMIFGGVQRVAIITLSAMRNLETLVWNCKFPLEPGNLSLFASSPAHNLIINGALITQDFSLGPPLTPPSWPLRSLVLMNVRLVGSWDQEHTFLGRGEQRRPNPTNNFFRTLFQLCSQTLESLTWETWNNNAWKPLSLGTESKSFPKLRQLRIKPGPDAIDKSSFASFLSAPLRSLELDHSSVQDFEDLIRSRVEEPYLDLEELVVNHDDNSQLITELIHKHNNLKKLWVTQSYYMSGRDTSFDRVLIPGLGKDRFNNLRSLYIQWGGQNKDAGHDKDNFDIMPESLAAICQLTTLEQLGLRCAEKEKEVHSYELFTEDNTVPIWLIDHGKLQAHLQNLKNLKLLVIRGDTYPPRANEVFGHSWYYRSNFANQEDLQTAKDHPELAPFVRGDNEPSLAWNHAHLYRMLEYAKTYRKVLPNLEWMLCGQRPMKFMEDAHGAVQPHPVGNDMDECKTFIRRVFGLASEIEIAHLKD